MLDFITRHPSHTLGPMGLLAADRFLKGVASKNFSTEGFVLIPHVLDFELFRNQGIAFSIPFSGPLLWILSLALIVFFTVFSSGYGSKKPRIFFFAYLLFIFGALSNLYDRIVLGYTTDYLIFFGRSAVNIADGMIIFGAIVLIWGMKKEAGSLSQGSR